MRGIFAQLGKPLSNGSATISNATPATLLTAVAGEWVDVYSIVISTNDTASQTVTISDGTTNLAYIVGGSGSNPPIVDQASIPVRFAKGATITATAGAVTGGKVIIVNILALTSKT